MDQPRSNAPEFTVSELAQAVKRTVEDEFQYVRVRGEISGFRGQHSSGHCYFTLKDDQAGIDAVIWKTTWPRLRFKPEPPGGSPPSRARRNTRSSSSRSSRPAPAR